MRINHVTLKDGTYAKVLSAVMVGEHYAELTICYSGDEQDSAYHWKVKAYFDPFEKSWVEVSPS